MVFHFLRHLKHYNFRLLDNQINTEVKKGLKYSPLGETLPKKHHQNFTLNNVKIGKLIKLI